MTNTTPHRIATLIAIATRAAVTFAVIVARAVTFAVIVAVTGVAWLFAPVIYIVHLLSTEEQLEGVQILQIAGVDLCSGILFATVLLWYNGIGMKQEKDVRLFRNRLVCIVLGTLFLGVLVAWGDSTYFPIAPTALVLHLVFRFVLFFAPKGFFWGCS